MSAAKKPAKPKSASKAGKKTTAKTAKKPPVKKTASSRGKTTVKKTVKKKTAKAPAKKTGAKKTAKKAPAKTTAKKPTAKKATAGKKKTVAQAPAKTTVKSATKATEAPVTPKPEKKALIRRRTMPKPTPVKKPRPAKLDKETLKKIRAQLEQEKVDLQRQQSELEEDSFEGSQSDLTGEVGLDEDFADAGTATFDRERDLSIRNNIRDLVEQVGRAISRIDEGIYGTCERCGQPIDAARLKALPHASLCLDCKRREERVR